MGDKLLLLKTPGDPIKERINTIKDNYFGPNGFEYIDIELTNIIEYLSNSEVPEEDMLFYQRAIVKLIEGRFWIEQLSPSTEPQDV